MKTFLLLILLAATVHAQTWVNLDTQQVGKPDRIGATFNPDDTMLLANNWRLWDGSTPTPAAGWVHTSCSFIQSPSNTTQAVRSCVDFDQATADAQAASNAALQAAAPVFVASDKNILTNGVNFMDEQNHVWNLTVSNGVQILTQVSFSPYDPAQARTLIASNAALQVAIAQDVKTNALYAAAMTWAAGPQNTLANALATYKPSTAAQTNLVRVQWMLLRMQARQEAGQ